MVSFGGSAADQVSDPRGQRAAVRRAQAEDRALEYYCRTPDESGRNANPGRTD